MGFFTYKQDDLEEYSKKLILENKRYRGRIPKKKRIRNKIQKKRENEKLSKFYLDEFHESNNKDMMIIGTSGKGKSQHYDGNGNRL
ncbi:hypothetical protein [Staphylococcus aureus]|uniref:hypothetical protein n=1 Tax=Staphylococcus aureus TaxID=1280 RepID=UPI000A332EAE|nr:hypothetical protein [Staphylococcus aureus]MDK4011958.1 hypothetical protein [Staphylococcus pseudintermedius]